MKLYLSRILATAAALLLLAATSAHANTRGADTDLFANVNSGTSGEANILIVMDNAADFSATVGQFCNIDSSGNVSMTTSRGTNTTTISGNNGTAAGVLQCALYAALNALTATSTAKFNISVMVFNANGLKTYNASDDNFTTSCTGSQGGCVVLTGTSTTMAPFTSTTKPRILSWIKNWTDSGNNNYVIKGNTSMSNGAAMQEAWAFYKGKTGVSGRTYTAVTSGCGNNFVVFLGNAYSQQGSPGDNATSGSPYTPLAGSSSTPTMNASPAATTAEKTAVSGNYPSRYEIGTDTVTCSTSNGATSKTYGPYGSPPSNSDVGTGVFGINWAKYMKNEAGYKTFSVGFLGPNCTPDYSTWLYLLAESGGGAFFPTNSYSSLADALKTVLGQIIAVNSVFASVSLPVSVNTQGSYLNQVYIGMFRPDASFLPKWTGNLKQYKLGYINSVLKLVDASCTTSPCPNSSSAINTSTGFITECARSYWTPSTTDTYWAQSSSGTCTTITDAASSNYPDGNVVEKGGHAYVLRNVTPSNRVVKTCGTTLSGCSSLTNFTTTTTTGTGMGSVATTSFGSDISATADMNTLIDWERGLNTSGPPIPAKTAVDLAMATTVMRSTVHGDVMHSRPVAINYGTDNSPQVVVYYGANDGMLHAINGNQTASITSNSTTYTAGSEMWSFVPPQYYSVVERNFENSTGDGIYYTGTSVTTAKDKWYGMDGPFTAFSGTISGSSKTYLYTTMRRGGRMVYAFDVTTAGNPSLLWRAGCMHSAPSASALSTSPGTAMSDTMMASTDCTVNSQDYGSIGQTWGSPKVIYTSGYGSGTTPVLLMAGGYDPCEDVDTGTANHNCGASAKGTVVYLIDGTNGNIIRSFNTVAPWTGGNPRPVVGDATVVNTTSNIAQYAYIADMGGVVYRLDFTGNNSSNWSMDAIAKVGCSTAAASCSANRKFMFEPSVVPDPDGSTYWVLLGSGDREKPVAGHIASGNVANYFFALKDVPTSSINSYLSSEQTNCDNVKIICLASLQQIDGSTGTASAAVLSAISGKKGWYLTLSATEQVVTSALTQFGNTTFSTHMPAQSSSSCSTNLGTTRVYNVNYATAASDNGTSNRYEHVSGDGLPPSPVAGKVIIDGATVPFCIGCSADSPLQGGKATQTSTTSRARSRLYWYIEKN